MKTVLYRVGSISIEDIERVIGKIKIKNKEENAPNAPVIKALCTATTFKRCSTIQKAFLKKLIITFKDKIESATVIHQEVCPKRAT
jgi:L-threonylcarbamoyladenylate synthase